MNLGISFVMLLTNWTLRDIPAVENIGSALKCAFLTRTACKSSFVYNEFSKQCTINPQLIPSIKNMTFSPGSVYFFSKAPSFCKDIQGCQTVYYDGEYWLYPDAYNNTIETKIYCHDMMTDSPKEYLTLHAPNSVESPKGQYVSSSCTLNTRVWSVTGKTEFLKIGINPETMTIDPEDYRFTNQVYGKSRPYGLAFGCSLSFKTCPLRANAILNIKLTGLVFDPPNEWVAYKFTGKMQMQVKTDHEVRLLGDGYCGGAIHEGPIKLQPDANYRPPIYSAKEL
ncbi:hypothetical protein LOTGIDRAFT_162464 [Lottia gigantea]|uniref:GON domain-containing protein n=1 Tax=Lottia gigantea TaxID=225164 RepID=V4AGL6_LOTGI|nr:hypothetical protein LOTGIDRAFT_162464 [Lottia gigantea]ESO92556.1 hypothetical protein LOTGIDRAFT_162464 [Lottia gigantea]